MASFLGSIFGFEFGTKIYLFWRLWQAIPDWLVLDGTGCEQSELCAALLWFYKHDSDSFALKQIPCHRLLHDGVSMSWHMLPRRGFKTMQRNCRGTSKCLQSCWGLEKLVLVSWKCHAVAWHHGLYEIWRQACQWFGFAFRLCSWSCMLAPRKSMQADACSSLPVRLDHLFFTCRFCLQCFVPLPSAVFSYVQTPNKPC